MQGWPIWSCLVSVSERPWVSTILNLSLSLSLSLSLRPPYMYVLIQMLFTYTIEYNRYTKHCNSSHPIVTTTHRHTLHPKHMYITPCHMHGTCSQEHMEVKGRQYQGSEMAKEQESNCKLKERNTYNCTDLD